MGSYTDETRRETVGDVLFRAAGGLVVIATATWVGLSAYPKFAIAMGVLSAIAVLAMTAWKARQLKASGR